MSLTQPPGGAIWLSRRNGEHTLAQDVAALEAEAQTAGRLIRAMLRHVNPSDVFTLEA